MTKHSNDNVDENIDDQIEFEETLDEDSVNYAATEDSRLDGAEEEADDAEAKLLGQINELNDKYLRVQADYQNYRKRTAKELAAARNSGKVDTLVPLLQLFDNFAIAIQAAGSTTNIESLVQGLNMVKDQLDKALAEIGVFAYNAVGEEFNPALHDAIATEESETVPEGVVIRQWNCGYMLNDEVLRPARVVVAGNKE